MREILPSCESQITSFPFYLCKKMKYLTLREEFRLQRLLEFLILANNPGSCYAYYY